MLANTTANTQQVTTNNEKEDLTTFLAIPIDAIKNPSEQNNPRVVRNIVIKQLADGSICLVEACEDKQNFFQEQYNLTETVSLKLVNDAPEKPPIRNRTILLHPTARKPTTNKSIDDKKPLKNLEPKPVQLHYKCITCDNSFDTLEEYHNHMKWHKCQKKFKCDKCTSAYNVESNLKIHMVLMHSEERNMRCPVCDVRLTFQRAASLRSHLMLHQVEEFYTCDECGGEFDKEDAFMKHMETHATKKKGYLKPLTCSYCKLEFKEFKEFKTHVSDHVKLRKTILRMKRPRKPGGRKDESNHVCLICSKSFIKNSLLERHLRIHSGEKPFKCQFCDRSFTQKGTLQIHLSRHTGVKPYACTLCPARFNQKGNLQVHVQKTHTFPAENGQKMYKCSQCACIFKKIATLNGHVTKAHLNTRDTSELDDNLIEDVISKLKELDRQASGNPSEPPVKKNKENEPKEHIIIENKTVDVPDFEKKNFINLTESANDGTVKKYLVRQRKVGDVRWYFCNYCSKQFKKPSDLIRHMRVHTKEKPFKCDQCNAEFTLKSTLLSHVKTHTNKIDYTCKVCKSSFSSLRVLNAHLRKHDFESLPKWQCITCGYLFDDLEQGVSHRENMGRETPHVVQPFINNILKQPLYQTAYGSLVFKPPKTRFPNTGSESPTLRPFHCTKCDARFTRRINLKRHIQFHNGDRNFKCNLCPKTFITSYRLKEHLNFHNNVKNYACKQCDKKFVTATLLKRHVIVHNTHKPYECPYCAKTFKTLLLSRTHITKVHKKEVVSKLNLVPETLVRNDSDPGQDVEVAGVPVRTENAALQNLSSASNNENMVVEQLLPGGENCIQLMNSNGFTGDLSNYPSTIYVNMNDFQFLEASGLNPNATNPPLKLQASDVSLINQQENMQVNDIIFNIDPLKPGLSLPPDEIFDTSCNENNEPTLPSLAEMSMKPIKLNGFSEENAGDKSGNLSLLLNNNSGLYTNVSLNNFLNLPMTVGEGAVFDSTASVFQPAHVADLSHADDIYETTNIMCISCSGLFVSLDSFQGHDCGSLADDGAGIENLQLVAKAASSESDKIAESEDQEQIEEDIIKCEVCYKIFPHKSGLENHLKTHSIKASIVCKVCKAVLVGRGQYIKHLAVHKGMKPVSKSCKFCFKEFKKPSDLKRHLRTHTGEKPFGCHLCGKTFSLKSTLESHVKTHDPTPKQFNCNVCNSFFSSKSSLKVHMTIHTGQRPYTCAFCDVKFRTVSNRKSHESLMHLSKSKKSRESKHTKVKNVLESVASGIISSLSEIQPVENNESVSTAENMSEKANPEDLPYQAENAVPTEENLLSTLHDDQIIDPVLLFQQLQMSGLILTNENNEPVSTLLLDDGTILNVDGTKGNISELSLQPIEPQNTDTITTEVQNTTTTVTTDLSNNSTVKTGKVRNLECDVCLKMYASKDVLRKHRKKVHGVNRKYPCIKCDRAFDTQDELSKHNKWHSGYRAFSCMYCANSFTEESGLNSHVKRMHHHSNATKTITSALLDVNFDLPTESIDDPLLNNLFTFKKTL